MQRQGPVLHLRACAWACSMTLLSIAPATISTSRCGSVFVCNHQHGTRCQDLLQYTHAVMWLYHTPGRGEAWEVEHQHEPLAWCFWMGESSVKIADTSTYASTRWDAILWRFWYSIMVVLDDNSYDTKKRRNSYVHADEVAWSRVVPQVLEGLGYGGLSWALGWRSNSGSIGGHVPQ